MRWNDLLALISEILVIRLNSDNPIKNFILYRLKGFLETVSDKKNRFVPMIKSLPLLSFPMAVTSMRLSRLASMGDIVVLGAVPLTVVASLTSVMIIDHKGTV